MTDECLSTTLTSIARDYAAIRQTLVEQAVDHKLLAEEVRQLRARIEVLEGPQQPQTLGQAATPGQQYPTVDIQP